MPVLPRKEKPSLKTAGEVFVTAAPAATHDFSFNEGAFSPVAAGTVTDLNEEYPLQPYPFFINQPLVVPL